LQIAVIGGGTCSPQVADAARHLGRLLAQEGHIIICGGLGGVMEAVCRGAREAGGLAVGILPGELGDQNPWVSISVATGMGHARNAIVVKSADALIALAGEYGTLSEMALGLKMGKRVISLQGFSLEGVIEVKTPEEAVAQLRSRPF